MNKTITPLTSFHSVASVLFAVVLLLTAERSIQSAKADTLPVDESFRAPSFAKATPPQRALLLPDGKYFLFFDPDTLTDRPAGPIVRFLADGTPDTSFNFSREYKSVSAAVQSSDGKLYISATRYLYGAKDTEQILRLNADGSIDPSFSPVSVGGTASSHEVRRLVIQPDGKLLVAGFFQSFAGDSTRNRIVRLLTNGAIDSSFVTGVINGNVYAVALQSDAKILIGGSFSTVNGVAYPGITRLNVDGSVDSSFQPSGFSRNGTSPYRGIAIQADGQIIVCGQPRTGPGFTTRVPLIRLTATGTLDPTFNSFGVVPSTTPLGRDVVIQPDGKIVAAVDSTVFRFTTNGSKDTGFRQPQFLDATLDAAIDPPVGTPTTVQLYANGQVFVGGIFTDVDPSATPGYVHLGVVRLDSAGNVDPTLVTTYRSGNEIAPSSFVRLTDGSTLITFTNTADPSVPYNLARLRGDGSRDPNFTLSSSDPNRFLANFNAHGIEPLPDGNFFVYGAYGWGKVRPDGTEDISFATNSGLPLEHATVAPDGKILLTAGTDAQTAIFSAFGRLLANGQIDSYGGPISGQLIRSGDGMIFEMNVGTRILAVQADGKALLEYFTSDKKLHFIRLNADSTPDGTFAETIQTPAVLTQEFPFIFDPNRGTTYQPPSGVWSATSLLDAYIQTDGRIILTGHFLSFGSSSARGIVRLNSDGTVDNTFNTGAGPQWVGTTETATFFPTVENIEPAADGKFLITGTFEAFNGTAAPGIAQLNADGSVDTSFVAPVQRDKRSLTASAFRAQPDGSFLLSGPYTFAGESTSRSLIRLGGLTPNVGNISTRLGVGTDENVLIEGFIVQGPTGSSKKIMVRAIGPSLGQFGIADALANPTLEIRDGSGATVATNNDWKTTQIGGLITGNQFAEINTSGLAPGNDFESAIIASLEPGSYTAVVRGAGNTVGTGVVDAFDLSTGSAARLANIATRGLVQPGDGLMIAGFIVQNGSVKVVARAIGPSLVQFGISNALPDTTIQLRDQQGAIVLENDDWRTSQQQELESLGLQPTHDLEAAVVATIQPGQYTAQVRGKGQASGIGVVQVYFIQ